MKERNEFTLKIFVSCGTLVFEYIMEQRQLFQDMVQEHSVSLEVQDCGIVRGLDLNQFEFNSYSRIRYELIFDENQGKFEEILKFEDGTKVSITSRVDEKNIQLVLDAMFSCCGVVSYGTIPVINETTTKECKDIVIEALQKSGEFEFKNTNLFYHRSNPIIRYSCYSKNEGFYWILVRENVDELKRDNLINDKPESLLKRQEKKNEDRNKSQFIDRLVKNAISKQRLKIIYK